MKVAVTMNPSALSTLSKAQATALAKTAQQMLNETRNDQVIPFDTGNTQNEGTFVDDSQAVRGKVAIVTDTPYARRIYYHPEYHFSKLKNMNAQGLWWEEWLTGDKKNRAAKLFREFYKRETGGYVK